MGWKVWRIARREGGIERRVMGPNDTTLKLQIILPPLSRNEIMPADKSSTKDFLLKIFYSLADLQTHS